jgi:hypothetical protein
MFSADAAVLRPSLEGGAAGFVIDWEHKGKAARQHGFNTQISTDSPDDLRRVAAATALPAVCRVNNTGRRSETLAEIDLAIDLGTANTLIIYKDQVVVNEPSIIAINRRTGQVKAVGNQAQQMHGKTHEDIKTIRPLKDGVIADFTAAELIILPEKTVWMNTPI